VSCRDGPARDGWIWSPNTPHPLRCPAANVESRLLDLQPARDVVVGPAISWPRSFDAATGRVNRGARPSGDVDAGYRTSIGHEPAHPYPPHLEDCSPLIKYHSPLTRISVQVCGSDGAAQAISTAPHCDRRVRALGGADCSGVTLITDVWRHSQLPSVCFPGVFGAGVAHRSSSLRASAHN
jgi:hypothetical protein